MQQKQCRCHFNVVILHGAFKMYEWYAYEPFKSFKCTKFSEDCQQFVALLEKIRRKTISVGVNGSAYVN